MRTMPERLCVLECGDRQLGAQEADRILGLMIAAGFYSPVHRISALL
jgi:hypothetical protein